MHLPLESQVHGVSRSKRMDSHRERLMQQNGNPKNKPLHVWSLIFRQGHPETISGEDKVFPTDGVGIHIQKLDIHSQEREVEQLPHAPCPQKQHAHAQQWIINPHVRARTAKPSKESICVNLHHYVSDNSFLECTTPNTSVKEMKSLKDISKFSTAATSESEKGNYAARRKVFSKLYPSKRFHQDIHN